MSVLALPARESLQAMIAPPTASVVMAGVSCWSEAVQTGTFTVGLAGQSAKAGRGAAMLNASSTLAERIQGGTVGGMGDLHDHCPVQPLDYAPARLGSQEHCAFGMQQMKTAPAGGRCGLTESRKSTSAPKVRAVAKYSSNRKAIGKVSANATIPIDAVIPAKSRDSGSVFQSRSRRRSTSQGEISPFISRNSRPGAPRCPAGPAWKPRKLMIQTMLPPRLSLAAEMSHELFLSFTSFLPGVAAGPRRQSNTSSDTPPHA